ncbi:hypothetical protein [Candidatus Manganitrophus noduliformans]|uniref:Uncharacterized protein n=1 Tax=Candidatus Manganitrophus noduliformans TaxID=2606439 RepID=A0A7X6DUW1_9BACT|nr:hypothetical protein [Candidatus Manganitrophus noduliformans]NKE73832.1 hypothetical protein [Candidatus Manganitrophus noduliformans]
MEFLLNRNAKYPKEWLVLVLWHSSLWLLLDGKEVRSQVNYGKIPCEPFFATLSWMLGPFSILLLPFFALHHFFRQCIRSRWDGVFRKLAGSEIIEVAISEHSSVIKMKKESEVFVLEIPEPGSSKFDIKQQIRAHHLDAWVISRSGRIFC